MENYKIIDTIGDGSFGTVYKATTIKTGEIVAIKKMKRKFNTWDECMSLRELKSLRKLNHTNIIKLKEALKVKDELYFVFELMEQNVYQLYTHMKDSNKSFSENQIRTVIYHTAAGLAYMHKHGFFHRDLKPENLLISNGITKIADFGLAREIRSRPPFTDYVATRWYRAPEILLKAPNYNSPVDIFALGCIMAELYLSAPLFKGNSELEQMYKICSILGTPTTASWSEGHRIAAQIGFTFPQCSAVNLSTMMPNACDDAIQLITEMLKFDPQKRPSAAQVLSHPYFANFVPLEKGLMSFDVDSHLMGRKYGSADEQHIKRHVSKENEWTTKRVNTDENDDHLDLLNDLGLEDAITKEANELKDYGNKKPEKNVNDWDLSPTHPSAEVENTDALLAEIEEYVNADLAKEGKDPYNKGSFSINNNNSGYNSYGLNSNYQQTSKPILTSSVSNGNMKVGLPPKNSGMMDNNYSKGDILDKGWGMGGPMGPSSYDLIQKNANNLSGNLYGKRAQYGSNQVPDPTYKFNSNSPHWSGPANNNMSNRGAQIMNTFVYNNKTSNANLGSMNTNSMSMGLKSKPEFNSGLSYGQPVDDNSDNFGRYGY